MMRLSISLAGCVLSLAAPIYAQDDPTICKFNQAWEAVEGRKPTVMIVHQSQENFDDEDAVLVAFFNENWSIAEGQSLGAIRVTSDDGGWFENEAVALNNGFIIWSEFDHIENVFGGVPRAMHVTRAGTTIDKLSLSGSFSDWMDFKRCRQKKVDVRTENERKESFLREIPKDPFAPTG